MQSIVW